MSPSSTPSSSSASPKHNNDQSDSTTSTYPNLTTNEPHPQQQQPNDDHSLIDILFNFNLADDNHTPAGPDGDSQGNEDDQHVHANRVASQTQQLNAIEHDAARLISILQQVSHSLSTRTSSAASMAAAHVIISEELSSLAKGSTEQLQAAWHKFLSQISQLRQYFDVISTLADRTAHVRQQVIRLEQQVMRI